MKNIIIAQEQGKAVAVGDNSFTTIKKAGAGNFLASLEILKEVLTSISTEPGETVHIYLPDMIQGIVTGSAIEYVKTGKTGSGKQLEESEIAGFKDFYKLYSERILNVRFSTSKYIKKEKTDLIALRNNAWTTLKGFNVAVNTVAVAPTIVDPNAELKAMIDKQIMEALNAMDMEKVTALTNYKNSLPAPTVVAGTAVATTNTVAQPGQSVPMPKFEDEADVAFNEEEESLDENGNPITFEESEEENTANQAW